MEDSRILSEGLYHGLQRELGSPFQVETRRSAIDLEELILQPKYPLSTCLLMGSRREGFKFPDSDFDIMVCLSNTLILPEDKHIHIDENDGKLILMILKCITSRPGFCFLQFQMPDSRTFDELKNIQTIYRTSPHGINFDGCMTMLLLFWNEHFSVSNGKIFFLSSGALQLFKNIMYMEAWDEGEESPIHGPCMNTKHFPGTKIDKTICFKCDFWPTSASSWTSRCQYWPSSKIVDDIISSGFHLVPIGSKVSHDAEKEWRISFSLAEYKLVKSMNHCQFLTYGLLKLFLKEVINKDDNNPILCSYFMKTAMFWEIQEGKCVWSVQALIHCFWTCFKRLMHWVSKDYCPNFFIPEHNMFLGKLVPTEKRLLLFKLNSLYEEGYSCIFHSSTVSSLLIYHDFVSPGCVLVSETGLKEVQDDKHFFEEIDQCPLLTFTGMPCAGKLDMYKTLRTIAELSRRNELECRDIIFIQRYLPHLLFKFIFTMNLLYEKTNRLCLMHERLLQVFRLVVRFSDITALLYHAILMFEFNDIITTLSVIAKAKFKLSKPYVIYNNHVNISKYLEAFAGKPLYVKFINASVTDVHVPHTILFEGVFSDLLNDKETKKDVTLFKFTKVPPLIVLNTLELFCYNRTNDPKRFDSLHSLYFLVHFDKGEHIPSDCMDISWYLLGVCQRICGDPQGAIRSFQKVSSLTNPKGFLALSISDQLRYCT